MGLLSDFTAYVDSLKRRGANTAREFAADPMGLLGRNVSAFSESLPAAPGEPPNEMLARPGMQDWATGVAMNAPTMGLLGHTVYHGSPHKFDKFDASKIGTGEGAQAYGHGLYLADAPDVARSYISAGGARPTATPEAYAADIVGQMGGEKKALQHLRDILPPAGETTFSGDSRDLIAGAIKAVESGAYRQRAGSLYKVDLPDEWLPKMLDWDKPLSEQPEAVRRAMERHFGDALIDDGKTGLLDRFGVWDASSLNGERLYYEMQKQKGGKADAAALLRDAGIPGIRYLDQGSRGKEGGTYNYVVFPGMEHLLKILERE